MTGAFDSCLVLLLAEFARLTCFERELIASVIFSFSCPKLTLCG